MNEGCDNPIGFSHTVFFEELGCGEVLFPASVSSCGTYLVGRERTCHDARADERHLGNKR